MFIVEEDTANELVQTEWISQQGIKVLASFEIESHVTEAWWKRGVIYHFT